MLRNRFSSILILAFLLCLNTSSFSEEEKKASAETISQNKVFKISEESITSLGVHLTEEKFELLKSQLLDKEYSQQTLSLIEGLKEKKFTDEEIKRAQGSITLYFEVLEKINRIAPLVFSLNKVKQEIEKKEKNLKH